MATIKIGTAHGGTGLDSLGTSGQILGVNSTEDSIAWLNPFTQATYAFQPVEFGFPIAKDGIGYVEFTPSPELLNLLTTEISEDDPTAIICTFPVTLSQGGAGPVDIELVIGTDAVTPDFDAVPYSQFKCGYSGTAVVPVPVIGGPLAFIWNAEAETLRLWIKNLGPDVDSAIIVFGRGTTMPVIVYKNGFS